VLAIVGLVSYHLSLLVNMKIHNVFHVSLLNKYVLYISHVVNWNVIHVELVGEFQVEPLRIIDQK
jgi:hypothetical protein